MTSENETTQGNWKFMTNKRAAWSSALLIGQLLFAGTGLAQEPAATDPAPPADAPIAPSQAAEPVLTPPSADTAPLPDEQENVTKKKRSAEETITVTGSRIRRKDLTSSAPITLIGREQMRQSGRVSVGDFLQTLPEQGNATNTSVNNGGDGSTRVDLRGLGASRTLVLVNGRRWVPGGLGADDSVDVNSIPASAIERIEVLKDGASAVYGSDAIAGVINIITKKRFEGGELNVFAGSTTHGDGTQYSVDGTAGTSGDRGSILFSTGYFQAYPILAGNRRYASPQVFYDASPGGVGFKPSGSSTIPAGRILGLKRGVRDPAATSLYNDLVTNNKTAGSFIRDPDAPLGWRPFKGSALAPIGDGYNYQDVNYLTTPQKRFSLFATGDVKLGNSARAYFEAAFVQRNSDQQLAPEPLVLDPGGSDILTSKDNIYNPFGKDVYVRRRLLEFGPRSFKQDLNNYRLVAGLDGSLPEGAGPLKGWFWDLSLNYARFQGTNESAGSLRKTKIANAVGPSFRDAAGVAHCGAPGAEIEGCVPLDLFHGAGSIASDQVGGLTFTGIQKVMNALTSVQANTSGELFKLFAARPVGLALGYEYRFQAGQSTPDPIQASGESSGNNQNPTAGHFYSNEAYAEISIPIVSDVKAFDLLEVTGALRYFNYNTFGSGVTGKIGGIYRPIQGLSVRGTYSTAFRAPSISDLFTGQVDSFENIADPCSGVNGPSPANCGAAKDNGDVSTQLKAKVGGNPTLTPETAVTITGGVVLEPGVLFGVSALKRLSLTVDYYQISISNAIQALGGNTILAGCYPTAGEPNKDYCGQITRDPGTQIITRIDDFNLNAGSQFTNGIDFAARYGVTTPAGEFNLAATVTWLKENNVILGTGDNAQLIRGAGNWDLNGAGVGGTYPHVKWLGAVNWNLGGLGIGVSGHYIGAFKECGDPGGGGSFSGGGLCYQDSTYQRQVAPYFASDVFVSYRLETGIGKTVLMVGMNNIFDQTPPFIGNAFQANTDPAGGYDISGRFLYVRMSHAF